MEIEFGKARPVCVSGDGVTVIQGPPGDSPHIGGNGNWWVGGTDTGVPASGAGASDHAFLSGRDRDDQHPLNAVTGLKDEMKRIPPPVEAITNSELEELLK